jgi:MarR family transcriptional regulator, organic hydroperoxide resistance regulator
MLDLSKYLPYLLNRAGAHIAAAFNRRVREYGITLPIWRVLAALNHRDGQRIGELAEMTAIEISTLSRVIDLMVRRRLAGRRRGGGDARAVTVHLTVAGRALTRRIVPVARRYETVALAGFSKAEGDMLRGMLIRLYDNIQQLDTVPQTAAAE